MARSQKSNKEIINEFLLDITGERSSFKSTEHRLEAITPQQLIAKDDLAGKLRQLLDSPKYTQKLWGYGFVTRGMAAIANKFRDPNPLVDVLPQMFSKLSELNANQLTGVAGLNGVILDSLKYNAKVNGQVAAATIFTAQSAGDLVARIATADARKLANMDGLTELIRTGRKPELRNRDFGRAINRICLNLASTIPAKELVKTDVELAEAVRDNLSWSDMEKSGALSVAIKENELVNATNVQHGDKPGISNQPGVDIRIALEHTNQPELGPELS